jgi:sugar/nucleoside kinase (ribokinase family)
MPSAFDWLVVGDVAVERSGGRQPATPVLGGAAARLAAHGAALGATVALIGKTGDDPAGRLVREMLARVRVNLSFAAVARDQRTSTWVEVRGRPDARRVERGADLLLRLDEIPSPQALRARLTLVSGFSLSVEPARAAVMGALRTAADRGGLAALQVEADLLWWTNARMARKVLEPALAAAHSVALTTADAEVLFGGRTGPREAAEAIGRLGPAVVYLAEPTGGVLLLEGGRPHALGGQHAGPWADRFAGPAAFWVGLTRGLTPRRAAAASLAYAQSIRRAGVPRIDRSRPA